MEDFAPTFKIKPGIENLPEFRPDVLNANATDLYAAKRAPAWTDRILYFSASAGDGKFVKRHDKENAKDSTSSSDDSSDTEADGARMS